MSISEKLLSFIGVAPVTNRDELFYELEEMDNERIETLIANNDLFDLLDSIKCDECKEDHGGKCPRPGDSDTCPSLGAWLGQRCRRECLIGEV